MYIKNNLEQYNNHISLLKDFYLFIFRERGREGEKEGKNH